MIKNTTNVHSKDFLTNARLAKTIELIVLAIIDIAFFCFIFFNKDLHSAVFGNKYLLITCGACWIILIVALVFLIIDFSLMKSMASQTLDLTKEAYNDALTGLPNRHSIDLMIKLASKSESISNVGCVLIRLSNLKLVNITDGLSRGDSLILDFCQLMIAVCNNYGFVGRNGGNDFLGLFENCTEETISSFISDLNKQIEMYNLSHNSVPIEIEYSYVLNSSEGKDNISDLITVAYHKIEDSPLR